MQTPTMSHPARWRRVYRRWGRVSSLVVAAFTAAMLLAGCAISEGRAEDTMTISNGTDAPITVTYELNVDGKIISQDVANVDPGTWTYVSPQLFGSDRCLRGDFVARSGNEVLDRLPRPCKQQQWTVTG